MYSKTKNRSVKDSADLIFVVSPKLKDFSHLQTNGHRQVPKKIGDERSKRSHGSILRIFFWFAYHLCISPFRIVKEADSNIAKKWFLQMIACAVTTLAALLTRVTDIRKAFPNDEKWNPVVYFRIFYAICSLALTLNAWWSLWRRSDRFVDVVEYIDSTKALPYLTTKICNARVAVVVCFIYALLGLVSAFLGTELMDSKSWSLHSWGRCLILEGRYQFFIGAASSNCNQTRLDGLGPHITTGDHIMAVITGFGQVSKYITSFYWELLILFGILSLWLPSAAFANFLKDDDDEEDDDDDSDQRHEEKVLEAAAQWPMLEEQYLSLKDLSDLINNAFGGMVFSYTFTSIFYYSINLDAFLLTSDILVRIRLIVLYLGAIILYILAADICRQVGQLEIWLSEYADDETKSNVPFHRLTVILNELSTSTISIRGWDVFSITYSVVANILSVLITYFIICVQFRSSKI